MRTSIFASRSTASTRAMTRALILVAVCMAAPAGCMIDPSSRTVETAYPPASASSKSDTNPAATANTGERPKATAAASTARPAEPGKVLAQNPIPLSDPETRPAKGSDPARPDQQPAPLNALAQPAAIAERKPGQPPDSVRPGDDSGPRQAVIATDDRSAVPSPLVIPLPFSEHPIDLATALRLADVANPTIGAARTLILEALANQLAARTLLVPSLNAGATYHDQNGVLQRSSGKILSLSEQSLYVGAGARVLAAETVGIPGVTILTPLTDAWFEPLAARQRVIGARFNARATANEILLDVATLYLQLLGNQSILSAQRRSESQVHDVVDITRHYAEIGLGRDSDANRAFSQWKRRRADVIKAEEELAVTAARLANRLNLDPSVRLEAAGGPLIPLELVDLETPQRELLQVALRQRPDIASRTAAVGEAEAHFKQEIGRPLLPTLWLGFSGGVFGGGSNLVPPLVGNFGGRTDADVRVYWTLLNLGAGNLALIKERRAQIGQMNAERFATINLARGEVSASLADARAAFNQLALTRTELASAELGFKEDLERSRQNLGRPIEVLNSLTLLAQARVNLVRALVHYDQAQFTLWVSLGSPPPLEVPPQPART